ncbi:MAG: IS3 family transposase [Clostridiaceae bacterium]|nr:IS3 family transposase [Clostridiaceae bacterium]
MKIFTRQLKEIRKKCGFGVVVLKKAIEEYIDYYNTRRYQKRLNYLTPMEYSGYLSGIPA